MLEEKRDSRLGRWVWIFVGVGILLRLLRYAQGLPVWGDEAFLGVNILDRSYLGFLKPLEYIQVAPLGFLWVERGMYELWGPSEYVMRLVPTIAGVGGVVVFGLLARRILDPVAAVVATGIWAVSDLGIRHTVELKPYSLDFLAGVGLIYFAAAFWMERRNRWLVALMVTTPIAMFVSLPAVFVGAGIAGCLFLGMGRMDGRQRGLVIGFAAVLLASFAGLEFGYLRAQFAGSGSGQQALWVFPPRSVGAFLKWFVWAHSSNYFSYPQDSARPIGGICVLLMVIGAGVLVWRGCAMVAALVVSPIVITFLAAVLRRYPYGDSPRLGQHLAGPICLLMGVGIAALIQWVGRNDRWRKRLAYGFVGILLAFVVVRVVGMVTSPTNEVRRDYAKREFVRGALRGRRRTRRWWCWIRGIRWRRLRGGISILGRGGLCGACR